MHQPFIDAELARDVEFHRSQIGSAAYFLRELSPHRIIERTGFESIRRESTLALWTIAEETGWHPMEML